MICVMLWLAVVCSGNGVGRMGRWGNMLVNGFLRIRETEKQTDRQKHKERQTKTQT